MAADPTSALGDRAISIFGALYRVGGAPRSRWLRLIERRVEARHLRARGPRLPLDVFEQLAGRYLLDTLAGRSREDLPAEAWLWKRFSWDVHRAAESIVQHGALLDDDGWPLRDQPSANDVPAEAMASALTQRVLELLDTLPEREYHAVLARLACDMDIDLVYALLALPRGSRERANHNQAFASGTAKLRLLLASEGWQQRDAAA